ncbi:lipopolysaccharide biosynthesis protein [Sporosarcina sp. G11-34]|uniref:lipopolysaccharide biosynthesis protein n=1 Tax=Sporosarcina sp. G11-34 TaxID=2849605 RepID=UPI0022A990D1|nr:lipopolysaccharide biosynthesis protein [Sporosarcina sp. G11-34]MCZ2257306.1 lipopolysaccharide biosynthesis protein [Sporosarcina sp. G11-34]
MDGNRIKKSVLTGLFWKFMERGGTHGVQFIVQIVLARILLPKDFGLISVILIFITFSNALVQSGLNTALIQKKEVDNKDYSSVFYISLLLSVFLYIFLFIISPYIAVFLESDQISSLIRVLALTLFIGAFNSIQVAIVTRKMEFKRLFYSSLYGIVISGAVGIVLAYLNFGIWALVYQQILNQLIIVITLWITGGWRPTLEFSILRVKQLFSFGWKILMSSLIFNLTKDVRTFVIGKLFSLDILGYYNRGAQFPGLITTNINGSIQSVMFPAFAAQQEDRIVLKSMVRRSIVTSSFIVFPLMTGLAVIAEPLVRILLTDKWLPSVPFIWIFCSIYALEPLHTANQQSINAVGRSDITLKLNIVKRIIDFLILGVTIPFGIYSIAYGMILSGIIGSIINAYPNKSILNYGYLEQVKDIMPSLFLSIIMGGVVFFIRYLNLIPSVTLIVQIILGVITYCSLARVLRNESYVYITASLKEIYNSRFT